MERERVGAIEWWEDRRGVLTYKPQLRLLGEDFLIKK